MLCNLMITGHFSKHNYSLIACSHCIRGGQRTSCQHTSSYLSSLHESGGYYDRENDPCVSWKPACHIWNMKVIYSKGQYCNGRWKCYESELQLASRVRLSREREIYIRPLRLPEESHLSLLSLHFYIHTVPPCVCFFFFFNKCLNQTASPVSIHPLTCVQYMV